MTRAPDNLLAVRQLLIAHLNVDKTRVRVEDLEPGEVGIVGDAAHRGGYHCGSDRVTGDDYSVRESRRDLSGLTLDAAGLDVGMFTVRAPRGTYDLPHFSAWCVAQCVADTPDSRDIREIIWSPDGRTVRRWDRLRKRSTGDSSHRTHTHFSFFRDAIKAGRDQTPLFRRYLTTIGLIEAPTTEDDMPLTPDDGLTVWSVNAGSKANPVRALDRLNDISETVDELRDQVAELAARPPVAVDYDQLADAIVRRVLTPPAS